HFRPQLRSRVLRIQFLHFLPKFTGPEITCFSNNNFDLNNLVAAITLASSRRNSLFPQPQLLAALRSRRNAQLRAPVNRWHLNLGAQSGFPCGHRDSYIDVVAIAAENRMLASANNDIQIARRAAVSSGVSLACKTDALPVTSSGFDPHLQWLSAGNYARSLAYRTAFLYFPCSSALWTGHVEFHPARTLSYLPAAITSRTGLRLADHSRATAVGTGFLTRYVQPHDRTANGVPETNVDLIFKITARLRLHFHGCATTATKHAGENISEAAAACASTTKIGKIETLEIEGNIFRAPAAGGRASPKTTGAKAPTPGISFGGRRIDVVRIEAELIVDLALLGIAQNVIGLGNLFELFLGLLVAGIDVRMVFSGQLAKSLAYVLLRSVLFHTQNAVIIFLLCGRHLDCRLFLLRFTVLRHSGCLPGYYLPFSAAFQKRSRIAEVICFLLSVLLIVLNQAEIHHCHLAIRVYRKIVGLISGSRLIRCAHIDVPQNICLVHSQSRRPRIDHVISKEVVKHLPITLGNCGQ